MEKRDLQDRQNDSGPSKRIHVNQDAVGTTDHVNVNHEQMNQQRPENQQQPPRPNEDPSSFFDDAINPDQLSNTRRQFILSYEEVRKMRNLEEPKISYKIHRATGIGLYFAYPDLNDPQKTFIGKVFEALNRKMNVIIESSTGTGKTLSLLTGTLSWMENARCVYDDIRRKNINVRHNIDCLEEANFTHVIYSSKAHSQLGQIQKELLKLPYRPKMVLFGSRQKLCNNFTVQWKHGINQDKSDEMKCRCNAAVSYMREFKNKPALFNNELKQLKIQIHNLILNCLEDLKNQLNTDDSKEQFKCLKKISQLYLLKFRQPMSQEQFEIYKKEIIQLWQKLTLIEQKRKHENSINVNIQENSEAKRKVEMQKQYEEQMKRNNQKIVKQMKDKRADLYYTNQLIKKCSTSSRLTPKQKEDLLKLTRQLWSMESRCPYYKKKLQGYDKQFYKSLNPRNHGTPLNIEKIKQEAQKYPHKVCTYLLPRRIDDQGDLYLMPYNYLLDQSLLPLAKKLVKNSILVFDQGHNVDKSAREGYSVTLNKKLIREGLAQIKQKIQLNENSKDIDEIELQRLQKEFRYESSYKQNLAETIYDQLRKQDIQRQRRNQLIRREEQKKKRVSQRNNQQNQPLNSQNNMNQGNRMENDQEEPMPEFTCDFTDDQLRARLIAWLVDILKIINQNMNEFFSQDKKISNVFDEAINSGVDASGWKDHAWKHTPVINDIRNWIKKILFSPNQLGFSYSLENQNDELNILKKIIKKLDQIIDLKFARDRFNFKIKALQRFFIKLENVLYHEQYKQKYYLFMKQQTKWSRQDNVKVYNGQIELKCLTSEFAFKALQNLGPRSIIITSGTLNPIDRFMDGLGIQQNSLNPITAGSVIKQSNIYVRKIGCDLSSRRLWIDYKYFFNQNFFIINAKQTFNLLIELIKRIPNGVLIMISSYTLSQKLQKFFYSPDAAQIRTRFLEAKPFVEFEKKKTNAQQLIKKYNYFAKKKQGAALFCVCRAKLTQGIDFKDQLCRGVIVLGIPLLRKDLPQVKQMKRYLQHVKEDLDFDNWMLIQVAKAINQALGRVVRDQKDYGSIFLVDPRYNSNSVGDWNVIKQNISGWIRQQWKDVYNRNQLKQQFVQLKNFFDGHEIRRQRQKEQRRDRNDVSSSDDEDGPGDGNDNFQQRQSLSSTFHHRIQQNPNLPQMIMRQSVQSSITKNLERIRKNQNQMIDQKEDKDLQKALYESKRTNPEIKLVSDELDKKLFEKGLTPIKIKGDGNCLYRSVSYLQTPQKDEDDFDFIKQAVIQVLDRELDGPPHLVQQILKTSLVEGNNDDQKIRNYRNRVSRRNQYGTQLQLLAISYIFGVTFIVHRIDGQHQIYYPDPLIPITPNNIYHIGYYEFSDELYNHYFAITPTEQTLSQYNTRKHKHDIQKWNQLQKQHVEPSITKNKNSYKKIKNQQKTEETIPNLYDNSMIHQTPNPQSSNLQTPNQCPKKTQSQPLVSSMQAQNLQKIPDGSNQSKKPINYKQHQKSISQTQRKQFSENGRIVYSQSGTILKLNNCFKQFNVQKLLQNSWQHVQILEIENCYIFDTQWSHLVRSAHLFPNLRYISIGSNRIYNINSGDLERFTNLRVINFKRLEKCSPQTLKYLESLKQEYKNSQYKSKSINPIFRK